MGLIQTNDWRWRGGVDILAGRQWKAHNRSGDKVLAMETKTLWNNRLLMLWACGSPGSALAYHLGATPESANMAQRTKVDGRASDPGANDDRR
jgi:hypothetical protein